MLFNVFFFFWLCLYVQTGSSKLWPSLLYSLPLHTISLITQEKLIKKIAVISSSRSGLSLVALFCQFLTTIIFYQTMLKYFVYIKFCQAYCFNYCRFLIRVSFDRTFTFVFASDTLQAPLNTFMTTAPLWSP